MSMRTTISISLALTLASLLTITAFASASTPPAAAQHTAKVAGACYVVGKGTPWTYQGRKGTRYTVHGNRATACAVGIQWLVRLTVARLPKSPPGWNCIPVKYSGVCLGKGGAAFEWSANR